MDKTAEFKRKAGQLSINAISVNEGTDCVIRELFALEVQVEFSPALKIRTYGPKTNADNIEKRGHELIPTGVQSEVKYCYQFVKANKAGITKTRYP